VDWEQALNIRSWDGSLRDLYIPNTTLDDWDRLLNFLRDCRFELAYSLDGRPAPVPGRASEAFRREESGLLACRLGRMTLNCHFFCPEEIEFDLDPREIDSPAELSRLEQFMSEIGSLLRKEVRLSDENCRDEALCRYDPVSGRVLIGS